MLQYFVNRIHKLQSNSGLISLDIGNNSIKILQLSKNHTDYVVEQCLVMDLNQQLRDKKKHESMIIENLQSLIKRNNLPTNVVIAVPFSLVMSKEINLNCCLKEQELEDFLQLNMEKYAGFNAQLLNFDYQILQQDQTSMRIFLVAIKREQIEQKIKMLNLAGLQAKIIDVDVYALARAVRFSLGESGNNVAVININNTSLMICILRGEVVVHTQCDVMDTNLGDFKQLAALIINNLQLCISMLSQPIELIALCGEGVDFKLLMQHVAYNIDIQLILANPFRRLKFAKGIKQNVIMNIAPSMLVSFGLALHRFNYDKH